MIEIDRESGRKGSVVNIDDIVIQVHDEGLWGQKERSKGGNILLERKMNA